MIGVLGGGAWGLALAQLYAAQGNDIRLWARRAETVAEIKAGASAALPGVALDPRIIASTDPARLHEADIILSVIPAQAARMVLMAVAPVLMPDATIILCQKGVERGSLALPHEVAGEAAPGHPIAVLTGPSFAADVAQGLPTAVTIAAETMDVATALRDRLATPTFRPYPSDDLTGAQIGGAIKNVLAIACGIIVARGLGESARAATIARGFAEMNRLAQAMGGRAETMAGLSGLGDLALTCASAQSRNFAHGLALGKAGDTEMGKTVEGAASAEAVVALGEKWGVDLPISKTVEGIITGNIAVSDAVMALLQRPLASRE